MPFRRTALVVTAVALATASTPAGARAQSFLDVLSLTPGSAGTFTGVLGGVSVVGSIANTGAGLSFSPVGTTFSGSTVDGTSPQFSYAGIYAPTAATTDRVGFEYNITGVSRVTLAFGAPVTDLVFHVANLDYSLFDFSPMASGVTLLSGNGGGGDGLELAGGILRDANSNTGGGLDPATRPPTAGARSAYGSLRINGTVSSLVFDVRSNNTRGFGDGGSFTLSATTAVIPEPSTYALTVAGLAGVAAVARRRRGAGA